MSFSDLGSAVDDSFDPRPVRRSSTSRPRYREDYAHHGPRFGQWTVPNGTAVGSGVDDRVDTVHGGGLHAPGKPFTDEKPMSGSVLGRLARATVVERDKEKQRQRLAAVAEEPEDRIELVGVASHLKEKPTKFHIPRMDASRGIRIKDKAGRSEIVRAPSLPSHAPPNRSSSTPIAPDAVKAKEPSECRPSLTALVKSVAAGTTSSSIRNGARIVGKDGTVVYMPLPNGLGAPTYADRHVSIAKDVSASQKPADAERAARDAKALQAANMLGEETASEEWAAMTASDLQVETAVGDVFMAGGLSGSAIGSNTNSASVLDGREGFVNVSASIANSERSMTARNARRESDRTGRGRSAKKPGKKLTPEKQHDAAKTGPAGRGNDAKTQDKFSKQDTVETSVIGSKEILSVSLNRSAAYDEAWKEDGADETVPAWVQEQPELSPPKAQKKSPGPGVERHQVFSGHSSAFSGRHRSPPKPWQPESVETVATASQALRHSGSTQAPSALASRTSLSGLASREDNRTDLASQDSQYTHNSPHRVVSTSSRQHSRHEPLSSPLVSGKHHPASRVNSHSFAPPREHRGNRSSPVLARSFVYHPTRLGSQQQLASTRSQHRPSSLRQEADYTLLEPTQAFLSPRHHPLPSSQDQSFVSQLHLNIPVHHAQPTVFAGHGWISPHPLSIAPSWVYDPPQSFINLPPGYCWTSNGGTPPPEHDETMTYEEWQAMQDQRSVLSERVHHEGQEEQSVDMIHRQGPVGEVEEGDPSEGNHSKQGEAVSMLEGSVHHANWSRTTTSHRVHADGASQAPRPGWATTGAGTVKSYGRVHLRMPWDS